MTDKTTPPVGWKPADDWPGPIDFNAPLNPVDAWIKYYRDEGLTLSSEANGEIHAAFDAGWHACMAAFRRVGK